MDVKTPQKAAKARKLAEALKANLKRRKAAAKQSTPSSVTPAPPPKSSHS